MNRATDMRSVVLESFTLGDGIICSTVTVLAGEQVRLVFHPESRSLTRVSFMQAAECARRFGLDRFWDRATGRGTCSVVTYPGDAETLQAVDAAFAKFQLDN